MKLDTVHVVMGIVILALIYTLNPLNVMNR